MLLFHSFTIDCCCENKEHEKTASTFQNVEIHVDYYYVIANR